MSKEKRVVCGPYLPGAGPAERNSEGVSGGALENDDGDCIAYPYDTRSFFPFPPVASQSPSCPRLLFYRRQFPVYPEGAPTEAWDALRLHLGFTVHQAALDLNLPIYAVAAAVSAFHAVFPGHFTKEELCTSPHIVSRCMAACLFLAGKTSETNLKLREAVNCIDFLQWKLQQQQRLNCAAASNNQQQKVEPSFAGTETTKTAVGTAKQQPSSASIVTNSPHQSKADKQQAVKTEQRENETSTSPTLEGEGNKDTERTGQLRDADKHVSASASDARTKASTAGSSREEGFALGKKEEDSSSTAESQGKGSKVGKPRLCGIGNFFRCSRFLKGYVPMGIREYWHVRQECLREEERLLQALGFSLPLPYLYDVLLEALVLLLPTHQEAHLIWTIANDIASTPLPEHFSPPVLIAAAALCAKKLLAVAGTLSSRRTKRCVSYTTASTASASGLAARSLSGATPEATPSLEDPATRLHEMLMDALRDKRRSRATSRSSGSCGSSRSACHDAAATGPLLYHCKKEIKDVPNQDGAADPKKSNTSTTTETPWEFSGHATGEGCETFEEDVGGDVGDDTDAAELCDAHACAAAKAEEGMLEVLERLDPLLCGSPEYWTLCKSHERRGLERGGSRWARALPSTAGGWNVFNRRNPATAAGDTEDATKELGTAAAALQKNSTRGVAAAAEPPWRTTECVSAGGRFARQYPANLSEICERVSAVAGVCRATSTEPSEMEEQEEYKRLLKENDEDQRQRNIAYVQVAEACARLMEVYSLLLQSREAPSDSAPPPG